MSILYRKGSVNEADVVSRRPDFFYPDTDLHLRKPIEMFALWWDGKVPNLCYQSNETPLSKEKERKKSLTRRASKGHWVLSGYATLYGRGRYQF